MFILTSGFRFLDIMNYLGPGTTYEKWVKAYDCKTVKSWLPYEWFDSLEKLDYPGLPDYPHWYSNMKGDFVLKLSEWKACKKLFREKGMKTFKDWVRYYNDLDVAPGLEALLKIKNFYEEKGIDIMKDAVSIPGVSLNYLLKGSLRPKQRRVRDAERSGCRRSKHHFHKIPRSWKNKNKITSNRRTATLSKHPRLRCQRPLSLNNASTNALLKGKS